MYYILWNTLYTHLEWTFCVCTCMCSNVVREGPAYYIVLDAMIKVFQIHKRCYIDNMKNKQTVKISLILSCWFTLSNSDKCLLFFATNLPVVLRAILDLRIVLIHAALSADTNFVFSCQKRKIKLHTCRDKELAPRASECFCLLVCWRQRCLLS